MILVFLNMGGKDCGWALAFAKTKSIAFPIGFHLGWNFIHNTVFSKGPYGQLIFISEGGHAISELVFFGEFNPRACYLIGLC